LIYRLICLDVTLHMKDCTIFMIQDLYTVDVFLNSDIVMSLVKTHRAMNFPLSTLRVCGFDNFE